MEANVKFNVKLLCHIDRKVLVQSGNIHFSVNTSDPGSYVQKARVDFKLNLPHLPGRTSPLSNLS